MSRMKVKVLQEAGYEMALLGLSFNKKQPLDKMPKVAKMLAGRNKGHDKFMESIYLWIDVKASRTYWQEADTYRHASKQSESTMYTILKDPLIQSDFEKAVPEDYLIYLNRLREDKLIFDLKYALPEGYLQRRLWCMNYKCLRNIIEQRLTHKLPEWSVFIKEIYNQVKHPELLPELLKGE